MEGLMNYGQYRDILKKFQNFKISKYFFFFKIQNFPQILKFSKDFKISNISKKNSKFS